MFQPHKSAFAVSLTAAFMLNVAAIAAFGLAATRLQSPGGAPASTTWITAVSVPAPAAAPARTEATMPAPALTPPEVPPRQEPKPAPSSWPAPVGVTGESDAARFYKSGEVERRAEPDSDWNLDTAALDTAGIETLVFDIFVNSDGAVVGTRIIEPAVLPDDVRTLLTARLRETQLRPAWRQGVAVASVQRIEVSVLPPMR